MAACNELLILRQRQCWEFEDVDLQYEKSRRRNHWKFLNGIKADNLYEKVGLHEYERWSKSQGFANYAQPLPSRCSRRGPLRRDANAANICRLRGGETASSSSTSPACSSQGGACGSDSSTLPKTVVDQIIGKFAGRVVNKGSEEETRKLTAKHASTSALPKEVVNQIIGEYAEKVVDKGSKKEKKLKKEKKISKASKDDKTCKDDELIPEDPDTAPLWERKLRILMSEFSMPRDKAEKVMTEANGEPYEAVRIVGELVKATMESLANQISRRDAIRLHIQAGWSASELRKAKQQWLAKAGIPREVQRMVLAGNIMKS